MLGAMATDYGVHTALTLAAAFIAHRINGEAAS
jgi:hypothetical protein